MTVDVESIRAFAVVAELGSFSDAARALNLSAPALTRRVQKLEAGVGVPLLKRTTRRVELTLPGREFLVKARSLIEDFDAALASIKDTSGRRTSRITVACIPTAATHLLPNALVVFNKRFRDIRVRIIEENANAVVQRVAHREVDLGITFLGGRSADLEYRDIREEAYVLLCRRDHALAQQDKVAWRELAPFRLVTASRLSGNSLVIDTALQKFGWRPNWFYEVQHLATSLGLVEAGLALVVLPELVYPYETNPVLVSRKLVSPRIKRTIRVVKRREPAISRAAEALFEIISNLEGKMLRSDLEA